MERNAVPTTDKRSTWQASSIRNQLAAYICGLLLFRDYNSVIIPYGPDWDAKRCRENLFAYNARINSHVFRYHICNPPRYFFRLFLYSFLTYNRPEVTVVLIGSMSDVLDLSLNSHVHKNFHEPITGELINKVRCSLCYLTDLF